MKKIAVLLMTFLILLTTGCGSDSNSRNPDYIYGTYDESIETVYELTGEISRTVGTDWIEEGSHVSFMLNISETACGGVVAFGENIYVYSSDKNDADNVRSELIYEIIASKKTSN